MKTQPAIKPVKILQVPLFSFDQLSKEAKQKAIEKLSDINVNYDWYEFTYEDAKNVGLIIKESDWMYVTANGEFANSAPECAELIIENHGKDCNSFKTAKAFLNALKGLEDKYEGKEDTQEREDELTDLEDAFLKNILKDYAVMLSEEWHYLQSEKAIIETIKSNEYLFEADGTMNNG